MCTALTPLLTKKKANIMLSKIWNLLEITIDGEEAKDITIDGEQVQKVTIDGNTVWINTKIIDDFEDGDISEYSGETGSYTVNTNSPVYEGSYSLKKQSSGSYNSIYSTSGLSNYPSAGDKIVFEWYRKGDDDTMFCWCTQDASNSNCYQAYLHRNGNGKELWLRRADSGSWTTLTSTSVNWPTGDWIRIEIDHNTDGTIIIKATNLSTNSDIGQISATDTTYTSGGIGWQNQGSSTNVVDSLRFK